MKKHFNWARQLSLINKFWFENRKQLLFMIAVTTGLLIVWMGVYLSFRNPKLFSPKFQVAYYFFGLVISGALIGNFTFADVREKSKAINFMLLPASTLEKLIVGFLFGVIVYGILYSIAFYFVNTGIVFLANRTLGSDWEVVNLLTLGGIDDMFFNQRADLLFLRYLVVQAFFVAGGLYFSKFSFFKTALAFFAVWIILMLLPMLFLSILPIGNFQDSLTAFEVLDVNGNKLLKMPEWFNWSFGLWFSLLITVLLWIFSYFKLKEKQLM